MNRMQVRWSAVSGILLLAVMAVSADAEATERVFEAEQWSSPSDAWITNRDTDDHWNLWSQDKGANHWGGGIVLRSPTVRADRSSPEEGAPPLHTHLSGIDPGVYSVFINRTGRLLAWSLDGRQWQPTSPGSETALGVFVIDQGTFDLWVDDRYANSTNIGPGYYDYVRLVPFTPPLLSHFTAYRLSDGQVQLSWISDRPVPTGTLEVADGQDFQTMITSPEKNLRNHRVTIASRPAGERLAIRLQVPLGPDYAWTSPVYDVQVPELPKKDRARRMEIPLATASALYPERPIIAGVPLPAGALWSEQDASLRDEQGPVPAQVSVASRRPDGSIKWLLIRALPNSGQGLRVCLGGEPGGDASPTFKIVENSNRPTVDNGWRWSWDPAGPGLFDTVTSADGTLLIESADQADIRLTDADGQVYRPATAEQVVFEETGPVRTVLRMEGPFVDDAGKRRFRYKLRYFLTADSSLVRVQLTLINDAESDFARLRSLSVRVSPAGQEPLVGQLAGGEAGRVDQDFALRQVDDRKIRITHQGQSETQAGRSPGWAIVQRGDRQLAVSVRDFWQTWPKGLALRSDGLEVQLLPTLAGDEYQPRDLGDWARRTFWFDNGCYVLRRGQAVRFEMNLRFGRPGDLDRFGGPQAWAEKVDSLPYASADAAFMCAGGVFGPVACAREDGHDAYERMVARNVDKLLAVREGNRAYGWANFGDWFGERGYNWGNSEYDLGWAMAVQFARSGNWRYFEIGEDMVRHSTTIDTIHVPLSPRMPGRLWTHSIGHVGAGVTPRQAGLPDNALEKWLEGYYNEHFYRGAIDTGGHIYQEGNFIYYFMTGDRDVLAAGELVAGAQAAYFTPGFDFGIERAAGWPLSVAVAAYEATGNPYYLNAARIYVEKILARQDPDGGGWLMPQHPSECDGKAGVGGKAFATGVLLYALMRYDLVEPRDDVKTAIIQACGWLVTEMWNEEKQGFRYKTGCDYYRDNADTGTTMSLCSAGLAYGWRLSGDERFAEILRKSMIRICDFTGDNGKQVAQVTRQSAYALPVLAQVADGDRTQPDAP